MKDNSTGNWLIYKKDSTIDLGLSWLCLNMPKIHQNQNPIVNQLMIIVPVKRTILGAQFSDNPDRYRWFAPLQLVLLVATHCRIPRIIPLRWLVDPTSSYYLVCPHYLQLQDSDFGDGKCKFNSRLKGKTCRKTPLTRGGKTNGFR